MLAEQEQKRWIAFAGNHVLINRATWCLVFWSPSQNVSITAVPRKGLFRLHQRNHVLFAFRAENRSFELFPLCFYIMFPQ